MEREDILHLTDLETGWRLTESSAGWLEDTVVREEVGRDLVAQLTRWLVHRKGNVSTLKAHTREADEALRRARKERPDDRTATWS
ncbi:MAG: hypothetical protein IT371_26180 [Deltaproteobacteria bacterium]|nr:hypothetical protein [Deltaproteobacteria bacterium]